MAEARGLLVGTSSVTLEMTVSEEPQMPTTQASRSVKVFPFMIASTNLSLEKGRREILTMEYVSDQLATLTSDSEVEKLCASL